MVPCEKGCLDWNFTGISKSVENGKYYYSKKGALDWGFIGRAWNIGQKRYRYVLKGKQIEDRTLDRAAEILFVANGRKNTGWQLKPAYDWVCRNISYIRLPDSISNSSAYFFNYGFDKRRGDCRVYAAMVYQITRVLDMDTEHVIGTIVTKDPPQIHSWVETKVNGQIYILDAQLESYARYVQGKDISLYYLTRNPRKPGLTLNHLANTIRKMGA